MAEIPKPRQIYSLSLLFDVGTGVELVIYTDRHKRDSLKFESLTRRQSECTLPSEAPSSPGVLPPDSSSMGLFQ